MPIHTRAWHQQFVCRGEPQTTLHWSGEFVHLVTHQLLAPFLPSPHVLSRELRTAAFKKNRPESMLLDHDIRDLVRSVSRWRSVNRTTMASFEHHRELLFNFLANCIIYIKREPCTSRHSSKAVHLTKQILGIWPHFLDSNIQRANALIVYVPQIMLETTGYNHNAQGEQNGHTLLMEAAGSNDPWLFEHLLTECRVNLELCDFKGRDINEWIVDEIDRHHKAMDQLMRYHFPDQDEDTIRLTSLAALRARDVRYITLMSSLTTLSEYTGEPLF